jgi:3-isopropylmalate/(R)-2-methylmalate dehydratase small subunit
VLAEGFARIFFRNCVATGELYPCECVDRLCDILKTGEVVSVDLDAARSPAKPTERSFNSSLWAKFVRGGRRRFVQLC